MEICLEIAIGQCKNREEQADDGVGSLERPLTKGGSTAHAMINDVILAEKL